MINYKSEKQQIEDEFMQRLELLRVLDKRQALDPILKEEHQELEKKHWATYEIISCLEKHGDPEWIVLTDLSFLYGTALVTCDLLLIANNLLYTVDIDTRLRSQKQGEHAAQNHEAESAAPYIHDILLQNGYEIGVQGYLFFLQPPAEWMTQNISSASRIITRHEFQEAIDTIIEEDNQLQAGVDCKRLLQIINEQEFRPNLLPNEICESTLSNVRPGIACSHCLSFDVQISRKYVTCNCGMHESLEDAIMRTIYEYSIVNHTQNSFTPLELLDFFNGDISQNQLMNCLEKYL